MKNCLKHKNKGEIIEIKEAIFIVSIAFLSATGLFLFYSLFKSWVKAAGWILIIDMGSYIFFCMKSHSFKSPFKFMYNEETGEVSEGWKWVVYSLVGINLTFWVLSFFGFLLDFFF